MIISNLPVLSLPSIILCKRRLNCSYCTSQRTLARQNLIQAHILLACSGLKSGNVFDKVIIRWVSKREPQQPDNCTARQQLLKKIEFEQEILMDLMMDSSRRLDPELAYNHYIRGLGPPCVCDSASMPNLRLWAKFHVLAEELRLQWVPSTCVRPCISALLVSRSSILVEFDLASSKIPRISGLLKAVSADLLSLCRCAGKTNEAPRSLAEKLVDFQSAIYYICITMFPADRVADVEAFRLLDAAYS